MAAGAEWQPVLNWWFGSESCLDAQLVSHYELWFGENPALDAQAQAHFVDLTEAALSGGLSHWAPIPEGWLALVLLLDQLPRSLYRHTPKAYAGDELAQNYVREGLSQGGDMLLSARQRIFLYIALAHGENLALQKQAVACFTKLHEHAGVQEQAFSAGLLKCALWHQTLITRFGRFPGRNAILGRASTDAEVSFLRRFQGRPVEVSGAFSL